MTFKAAEQLSVEEALDRLPESAVWIRSILARIKRLSPIPQGARILEIGACQGRGLVELERQGYDAYGIEPWDEARETAAELANRLGVSFDIRGGAAEDIQFPDEYFDIVIATSVMEHVANLERSLFEIHRVLKPGGIFWFNSASAMCPVQQEIRGFPLFGWYPDKVKKRIMLWAKDHRPTLVGHSAAPALHWWTNRNARDRLAKAGFERSWTRWELRLPEEGNARAARVIALIKRSRVLQRFADTLISDCSYAAQKSIDTHSGN